MSTPVPAGQRYKNRPLGIVPVQISVEREALDYARQHAIGQKALGRFISRLIYEERAREAEYVRLAGLPART